MPAPVELPVNGPVHDTSGFSRRLAILLSATACPGAGQFVQRRWLVGLLFMAGFIACLVMLILAVVVPIVSNLRIALDAAGWGSTEPFQPISVVKVLSFFSVAVLIYLAALLDVIAYQRRQSRRLDEQRNKHE